MTNQAATGGKQHLIQVAESLFTEYGYRAVSIRDIAQRAGMTNAALYYHFPNKETLFEEVLTHHVERLNQKLREAADGGVDHRSRIENMLLAYSQHVAERRSPLFLLRFKTGKDDDIAKEDHRTQHARHLRVMMKPFEEELRIAIDAGVLQSLPDDISPAALLLGLFHGLVQHRHSCQETGIRPADVTLILDIFWKGMTPSNLTSMVDKT
jgi:AcrR family transcriptional regulator